MLTSAVFTKRGVLLLAFALAVYFASEPRSAAVQLSVSYNTDPPASHIMFGSYQQLREHQERRSRCKWFRVSLNDPTVDFGYSSYLTPQWENENASHFIAGLSAVHPEMSLFRCNYQLSDTEIFVTDRVGPFTSTGGYNWDRWRWDDIGGVKTFPQPLALTSGVFLPYDKDGDILPVPPIHAHHWHLQTPYFPYRSTLKPFVDMDEATHDNAIGQLIFQAHADSQCMGDLDGFACYFQSAAPGQGYPLDANQLGVGGETNDLRAMHSPPLAHWLEVSAVLTTKRVKRFWVDGILNRPWLYKIFFYQKVGTTRIPYGLQSIHWKERTFSYCMKATDIWWHTHHEMCNDMWYFKGSAEELGVTSKFPLPSIGESLYLIRTTLDEAKAYLNRKVLETPGTEFLCAMDKLNRRFEYVPQDRPVGYPKILPGIDEGMYARLSRTCTDMTMEKGQPYTLVAFYEATDVTKSSAPYGFFIQHSNLMWKATACD